MKNDKQNYCRDNIADTIKNMVSLFEEKNLTSEQIMEYIKDMPSKARNDMHIVAQLYHNKELADRIAEANDLIKLKMVDIFKQSVANGTHEEFLATLPTAYKYYLMVEMGLYRAGFSNETPLTEEEERYFDIIESSINKDYEKETLRKA